jgi:hypothetical protein
VRRRGVVATEVEGGVAGTVDCREVTRKLWRLAQALTCSALSWLVPQ